MFHKFDVQRDKPTRLDVTASRPIKKWILAKELPEEENPNGIIETIYSHHKQYKAKVIACGPEVQHTPEGSVVCYTRNIISGLTFEHKGVNYVFLHEDKHCLFQD